MKKTTQYITLFVSVLVLLSACNDAFLERYPEDKLSPFTYFKTENDFQIYTNGFYPMLPSASEVFQQERADNVVSNTLTSEVIGNRLVPTTDGGWDWSDLRKLNFLLTNKNALNYSDTKVRDRYFAIAKFFRASFYFDKVKRYGDVPWYSVVIETNDTENLMKPRDSRVLVMDSILNDLDFAIKHLPDGKNIEQINKWTALALKSRICLYEGTFRKYHTEFNLPDANRFLEEAVSASEQIMNSGRFFVYNKTTGVSGNPYQDLFCSINADDVVDEVILCRRYSKGLGITHGLQFYLTAKTQGRPGLEKRLINSYLMRNGTPFTSQPGYDKMSFAQEMQSRDPRLAQTIRTPGYKRIGTTQQLAPDFSVATTGYQIIKYLNAPSMDTPSQSYQDMILLRYGEVLLNYAEAKAELGTLTQTDIDRSIKPLRDRVGMPNLFLEASNANPDEYQGALYPNISTQNRGVLLEIRRERRVEMVMERNNRWDDLMRWKEGHLVADEFVGMYFTGTGSFDLDGNGSTDVVVYEGAVPPASENVSYIPVNSLTQADKGNFLPHKGIVKKFDEKKDYLYPLPTEDRVLNPNLTQNPGWPEK